MIFPFEVKKNGIYYPAGTEVPTGAKKQGKDPVSAPGKVGAVASSKYSEEDLNLPYMKLKSLASKEGLKVEKTAKAEDIKNMLRSL